MAKEREIPWQNLHPWMKAAHDFGVANKGWFAVKPGSREHGAWAKYFDKLGWAPFSFRELSRARKDGETKEWTAPCQWPEWFTAEIGERAA